MKIRVFVAAALSALMLSGCYDGVELENRSFVSAIAVDSDDMGRDYLLGAEMLALGADVNNTESDGGNTIKSQRGATLSEAMGQLNRHSAKSLSYGLCKVCLIGEEILSDSRKLRGAVESLCGNGEISGKTYVVAVAGDACDILSRELGGEVSIGYFIANFYKDGGNARAAERLDLEGLYAALSGVGSAVVPTVEYMDDEKALRFSGAAILADGRLAGYVTDDLLAGMAWINGGARGARVTAHYGDMPATLLVSKSRVKLSFAEEYGGVRCTARITAWGAVEDELPPNAESLFADEIESLITRLFDTFQSYGADGYGLLDTLNKRRPDMRAALADISLEPEVRVIITNYGTKK